MKCKVFTWLINYQYFLTLQCILKQRLELGEIVSFDGYKLYNNRQADVVQSSIFEVTIENKNDSCIWLADDALLLANTLVVLSNLLFLTF